MSITSMIQPGAGGLPRLDLVANDGSRAEVYLHGAQVTSWVPAGGQECLFLSRASEFRPGAPIRGGIPVAFPQFGTLGPLPQHGFARLLAWEFTGAEDLGDQAVATFRLRDSEESRKLWPHAFLTELTLAIGGKRMRVSLSVTNPGAEPFDFTACFHTYLQVFDLGQTCVNGLHGLRYRDAAAGSIEKHEEAERIHFIEEVNRVYFHAPPRADLVDAHHRVLIQKAGFTDTVVWNPAAAKCATMPDLEADAYQHFVCVEAAMVETPVHLEPDAFWEGSQELIVEHG